MRGRLLVTVAGAVSVVVAIAAGCGHAETSSAVSPAPTSDREAAREELIAACDGTPVPWAAPYAGEVHPLVVVQNCPTLDVRPCLGDSPAINQKFWQGEWTSPIQLVVCAGPASLVFGTSCGRYSIGGRTGEIIHQKQRHAVRVIVAKTGELLTSANIDGSVWECPEKTKEVWTFMEGDPLEGDPPWVYGGPPVPDAQINDYATRLSTQPAQ